MNKAVTLANLVGFALPLVIGVFATGCVNLDKPSSVADCSSGHPQPCVNGDKSDAAATGDTTNDDAKLAPDDLGNPDATVGDAGVTTDDATGANRADAGTASIEDSAPETPVQISPDALPGDAKLATDATADTTLADTAGPDFFPMGIDAQTSSPDMPSADAVGVNADAADALPASPDTTAALPESTTIVNFKSGKATGTVMNGYGWVTLGSADSVTSPVCGAAKSAITSTAPCLADTSWDSPTKLCVTGTVPAASDYAANWGLQVGVNVKDKSPLVAGGIPFKWVGVNVSGIPSTGLRLELHRNGDKEGVTYCSMLTTGDLVPVAEFNTQCWSGLGSPFPDADGSKIDEISVQVSPASASDTAVTGLCFESVILGN
jgi:hypothetical protein